MLPDHLLGVFLWEQCVRYRASEIFENKTQPPKLTLQFTIACIWEVIICSYHLLGFVLWGHFVDYGVLEKIQNKTERWTERCNLWFDAFESYNLSDHLLDVFLWGKSAHHTVSRILQTEPRNWKSQWMIQRIRKDMPFPINWWLSLFSEVRSFVQYSVSDTF